MTNLQIRFVLFMFIAASFVSVMRRRGAIRLAKQWVLQNGATLDPMAKAKINVFVWPVRVTVHTIDQAGNRSVVELDVGEPRFGGWFHGKVTCVSSRPA